MADTTSVKDSIKPSVKWAQRKEYLLLTIELEDSRNVDVKLTETELKFSANGGKDQKFYAFTIEFYKEIVPDESKHVTRERDVFFNIKKLKDEGFWPRPTKGSKPHFIKTDFNLWKDEDESDDDVQHSGGDANFEEMMKNMGGMNNIGDQDDASDDSDDAEIPDLE